MSNSGSMERRLSAILAADVVGYSRLMGANESGTLAALRTLQSDFLDGKISEHQGRIVKLTGDGMLVEFPSVVNAVACAAEMQRGIRDRNQNVPQDRRIEFRMGVNVGDVIAQGDDIFGDGVNVAARLESIAAPGGITISGPVRDHLGNRLDLTFEDMGEQTLKNIERPIRVYRVSLDGPAAQRREATKKQAQPEQLQKPSIAVLPFNNMSGDPEQEYFSDGITEDIITDLSNVSGLFVVARNTAFTYKGKAVKVQQVAQELGVRFILEGSVRKAGSRVRVTGQLIHGKDGGHRLGRPVRSRSDRHLSPSRTKSPTPSWNSSRSSCCRRKRSRSTQAPTDNVEAYTFYLRGRQFLHRHSKSNYQLARRMFAKAVELDPLYARAYAGIADCDSFLFAHYHADAGIDGILATSAKALALDNQARRSACLARIRAFAWKTIRGSRDGIRTGDRARSEFLRGSLLLWPCLLHAGQARAGSYAFRARGRNQAGRLSIIDPVDSRFIDRWAAMRIKRDAARRGIERAEK